MTAKTSDTKASAAPELVALDLSVLDGSVDDVVKLLPTANNLDELEKAETEGKTRKTLMAAIEEERQARLEADNPPEEEEDFGEFPRYVHIVKYDDKIPTQVGSVEQLKLLFEAHGRDNVKEVE
jgi:hypothetical protein